MTNLNTITKSNLGDSWAKVSKSPLRFLVVLTLVGMLAMASTFGSVSAAGGTTIQAAGDYTVSPPELSGPPVTENGVTTIAGTVLVNTRGTQIGSALVTFTCVLGADGAQNKCQGTYDFEGTYQGKTGTYRATMTDWTAGGDAAFTSSRFNLIPGSGTGELSQMVSTEGFLLRDEAAGPVGVYFGTARFEAETGDLSGYTVSELFHLEAAGTITTDQLVAELSRRDSQ